MPVPGGGNVSGSGFPPYPANSQYSGGSNVYPPYPATASSGFPYPGSYSPYAGSTPGYPTQGYTGSYAPYPPSTQPVSQLYILVYVLITERFIRAKLKIQGKNLFLKFTLL